MKSSEQPPSGTQWLHSEDGSVSFISLVIVLGMAVLIGFVGNMTNETIERQKLQNAADATAYSSAVWMARGMNTICTLNHIMGELTALVVIIEALGGPEAEGDDFGNDEYDPEREYNKILKVGKSTAPEILPEGKGDRQDVSDFVALMVDNHKKHQCGAALYDAEVSLKKHATICFFGKMVGNILELLRWIPWGIGEALYRAGKILHIVMNLYMKLIEVETNVIRFLERIVSQISPMKGLLRTAIRTLANLTETIPWHIEPPQLVIAGLFSQGTLAYGALSKNANRMRELYGLKSVGYGCNGLPVMMEPWVNDPKKNKEGEGSENGEDVKDTGNVQGTSKKSLGGLPWWMGGTKKRSRNKIDNPESSLSPDSETSNPRFPNPIKKPETQSSSKPKKSNSSNPSYDSLRDYKQGYEEKTQWVRATYPYVAMYRTPLGKLFGALALSNLTNHFNKWTEIYTLNESYSMHAGEKDKNGEVKDNGVKMWVMEGTRYEPNSNHDKGKEPWTDDHKKADACFSVVCWAESHPHPSVFSPYYFKKASRKGPVAISQAMIYNLNGRRLNGPATQQPDTGWDTLQWEPHSTITAPEWGHGQKSKSGNPFSAIAAAVTQGVDLLKHLGSGPTTPSYAKVRLNWQAKLRPITIEMFGKLDKHSRPEDIVVVLRNDDADLLTH